MADAKKTCLIVEDNETNRKVASMIIKKLGFEVLEAKDGKEGLKKCVEAIPDVILLDMYMPEMGGNEFLRSIRRTEGFQNIPVVMCSAENAPQRIGRSMIAGADTYIIKPFHPDMIKRKFEEIGVL